MDHAYKHARKIVDEGDRLIDQARRGEQRIEYAIALQEDDPCCRAHKRRRPERQQHDEGDKARRRRTDRCHDVGDRIAENDRAGCDQSRDQERVE